MLEADIIEPSNLHWAAPIVLVKKRDGTTRFCVDYRKQNNVTIKDAYPLPRIKESRDTLSGAKFFYTLDLASGYWQVSMDKSDKEKKAFATHKGLYSLKFYRLVYLIALRHLNARWKPFFMAYNGRNV